MSLIVALSPLTTPAPRSSTVPLADAEPVVVVVVVMEVVVVVVVVGLLFSGIAAVGGSPLTGPTSSIASELLAVLGLRTSVMVTVSTSPRGCCQEP